MAKKARKKKRAKKHLSAALFILVISSMTALGAASWYQLVYADTESTPEPVTLTVDPNIGIQPFVEEYLRDNDAERLLPIIKCESEFKHFEPDGTPLKNRAGSSAIGVAQIMSSLHPDPKVVERYNKRHDTDFTVEDIDITTVAGNIGYAVMLYELNGIRDWECSRFGW